MSQYNRNEKQLSSLIQTDLIFSFFLLSSGEDRWRLELIQPGCAGARSPMYGTWTSAEHEDSGPTGPASYYRVDSRRWDRGEEKQE